MQILNKTFLYSLLAIFIVAGAVFAFMPADTSAQTQNCGCDIAITAAPSSASVGDSAGPFRVEVECYQTQYHTYSLENQTDGEYIMGPETYNDEGVYTFSSSHTFSSSGNKQLRAEVQAVGEPTADPSGCDWNDADTDSTAVSGGGSASMSVDIDGPSSITIPAGDSSVTREFSADFSWSGDSAQYRFFLGDNSYNSGYSNLSGSSANDDIPFEGAGTYEVCAQGIAQDGGNLDQDTNCMYLEVDEEPVDPIYGCTDPNATNYDSNATQDDDSCEYDPGEATLRVRSSNPSSEVVIAEVSGNLKDFETPDELTRSVDLSGELRADASEGGNDFDYWQGCDDTNNGGRDCEISVDTGDTKTVTAVYDDGGDPPIEGCTDPEANNFDSDAEVDDGSCDYDDDSTPPPSSSAVLNVYSQNPSSGADLSVTSGNLPSNFSTQRTFNEDEDIVARIWAYDTHEGSGGNDFVEWQGCDDSSGRRCDVSVNTGSSQSITAVYDNDSTPPPSNQAVINVYSSDPGSGVSIGAAGSYNGEGQNNLYDINNTPGEISSDDDLIGRLWAEQEAPNGNVFSEWEGCDNWSNRWCDISVSVGSVKNITADYMVVQAEDPPTIDSFLFAPGTVDTSFTPPRVHVGETYELIWTTTGADTVTASGDWSGPKAADGSSYDNQSSISGTSENFSYTLTAENSGGSVFETIDVDVIDPPRFELSSDPTVSIDSEPGSQATLGVEVEGSNRVCEWKHRNSPAEKSHKVIPAGQSAGEGVAFGCQVLSWLPNSWCRA